jgi:transcriptional regulator with XRE-family HTH domain
LHNRIAKRFIYEILEARGWSVSRLATESGIKRSVLAAQLSGSRRIQPQHLDRLLHVLDHYERPRLLAAWVRDVVAPDALMDLLNAQGDDLSPEVKAWAPALESDDKQMLLWWADEMTRDGELAELFKLLSAKAGYRPK